MTQRDFHSDFKLVQHLAAAVYTSTQTPSNGIDTKGFGSLAFLIAIGTITNIAESPTPSWTFKVQESDSQSTGFSDITDASQILHGSADALVTDPNTSTGVLLTVDAAANDAASYRFGVLTQKRYARVVATAAETPGNTPLAILALLGHPSQTPAAD